MTNHQSTTTIIKQASLPAGSKTGVSFRGEPPRVKTVKSGSPLTGKLHKGQYVYGISVPGHLEVSNVSDSETLVKLLKKTSRWDRKLLISDEPVRAKFPMTISVTAPPGKLGVTFEGATQPSISRMSQDCPFKNFVEKGQYIDSIRVPGEPKLPTTNLSAHDVVQYLSKHSDVDGRVLVFTSHPVAIAKPVTPKAETTTATAAPTTIVKRTTYVANPTTKTGIDATIEGAELQIVTVNLRPQQKILSDPGSMLYMTQGLRMKTHTGGMGFRRFVTGSPIFMTEFINESPSGGVGTVAFGSTFPGKVVPISLEEYGNHVICQKASYLCSEDSMKINVEFAPSMGTTFFGGEGLILQGMKGSGMVWLHGSGAIIQKPLKKGETLRCQTGALMAFESTVHYDIERVKGGFKNVVFGGEGFFWTTLTGPGTVWLESAPVSEMVREIAKRVDKD